MFALTFDPGDPNAFEYLHINQSLDQYSIPTSFYRAPLLPSLRDQGTYCNLFFFAYVYLRSRSIVNSI